MSIQENDPNDTVKIPSHVFREYDIRGIADQELTHIFTYRLALALAEYLKQQSPSQSDFHVVIAHDCRHSGVEIQRALITGFTDAGVSVTRLGMQPTPILYFALHQRNFDAGIMITGSHNPAAWNGFKICIGQKALYGTGIQKLYQMMSHQTMNDREIEIRMTHPEPASILLDMHETYLSYVTQQIKVGTRPLKVVVDAGNGSAGPIAMKTYQALGWEVIPLYCEPNGDFPNHHPDPTVAVNLKDLQEAVDQYKADIGIAFDGDGDRIGVIDRQGRIIWGDQLLAYLAEPLLDHYEKASFIAEVKCSQTIFDHIRGRGGKIEMWKVGHSLIKARMHQTQALLAGEMSGHIFFKDRFFGYDDATYVGARVLEMMSQVESPYAQLDVWFDQLPVTYTTPELRVACADQDKQYVVQKARNAFAQHYDVIDIDGVRINFEQGWGLIRPSNTQPVLVMRFEAQSQALLDHYRHEVENWLSINAPEVHWEADVH